MNKLETIAFTIFLLVAQYGYAQASAVDIVSDVKNTELEVAVDNSELSMEYGLTLAESKELARAGDYIKFWGILEASDCFNTMELTYNTASKKIIRPMNGYSFSDPVQRDGVTPCSGGN